MRNPHTVSQVRRSLRLIRTLTVLLVAVALPGINRVSRHVAAVSVRTEPNAILQTTDVPILSGTFQAVNGSPGDQTDPHSDCDLVSYTNDDFFGFLSIHYFDFATNTDRVVPGNGTDVLSDVSGGVIAFTEASPSGSQIALFNTATHTRSVVPGFQNSRPSLAGNVLAFENRSFSTNPNESEISVYDLNSGTVTRPTDE